MNIDRSNLVAAVQEHRAAVEALEGLGRTYRRIQEIQEGFHADLAAFDDLDDRVGAEHLHAMESLAAGEAFRFEVSAETKDMIARREALRAEVVGAEKTMTITREKIAAAQRAVDAADRKIDEAREEILIAELDAKAEAFLADLEPLRARYLELMDLANIWIIADGAGRRPLITPTTQDALAASGVVAGLAMKIRPGDLEERRERAQSYWNLLRERAESEIAGEA